MRPTRFELKTACALLALMLPLLAMAQPKPVRVFILAGQSNMAGSSPVTLTGADTDVWFDDAAATTAVDSRQTSWLRLPMPAEGGGGIQAGAAEVWRTQYPGDRIAILKVGQGATGIDFWNTPGQPGYDALMERIDTVLARLDAQVAGGDISGYSVEGFLWMQGENEIDAYLTSGAEDYFYSLLEVLDAVRGRSGVADLPAAIGRTSWIFAPETLRPGNAALPGAGDLRATGVGGRPYNSSHEFINTGLARGAALYQGMPLMVRNGQMFLGNHPGVSAGWADADDLALTDYYHLAAGDAGAVTLGRRLGRELLRVKGVSVGDELSIHAGPHRWVHPGTVSITPTVSGLNGETPSYSWELITGPAGVSFSPANALNTSVDLSTAGTYAFRVKVATPTRYAQHTLNVIVLPADQNLPAYGYADPLFVGAPLQSVPITATVLNPDSDPLTYTWTRKLGSGIVTIDNPNALSTTARFHAAGSYTLRLAVNDGTVRADGNSSGWILLPVTVGTGNDAEFKTYAARFPFEEPDFLLGETRIADNQQVNVGVTRSGESTVGVGSGSFNGTSAYIQVDAMKWTNFFPHGNRPAWSFAAWIRPNAPATGTQVIWDQGGGNTAFTVRLSDGQLQAGYNSANGLVLVQTAAPAANVWTHVAAVADSASQSLTLYVNGEVAATATDAKVTTSGILSDAAALGARLGSDAFGSGTGAADFFSGLIDEARAYELALDDDAIDTLAHRAASPADPSAHNVGMNLWFLNDWDGSNAFADIMMHARSWNKANWNDGAAAIDAEGWPTEDASTVIFGRDNPFGTYKLVFEGQATSISGMWIPITVTNKVYDPATNTTTADFTLTGTDPSGFNQNAGGITLTGTRRLPSDPAGTGFRNLRLYRPGHASDGSAVFDQRFLAMMQGFHVIRFMDWVDTNKNGEDAWSNRWRPGMARRPTYTIGEDNDLHYAIPYELMVQLCNQLNADMWLNIPVLADDDYITKLAQLLKYGSDGVNPYTSPQASPVFPPLNPGLKVYVEYANEVWNSAPGFRCFPWILDIADAIADDPSPHPITLDPATGAYTETDRYTLQARYTAYRSVQISDLFRSV